MAKKAKSSLKDKVVRFLKKLKKKRPGVHSKKGSSKNKNSDLYKKINIGQGRK